VSESSVQHLIKMANQIAANVPALSAEASRAFGANALHFPDQTALIDALQRVLAEHPSGPLSVLVKGSRSSAMERVVAALLASHTSGSGPEVTHAV